MPETPAILVLGASGMLGSTVLRVLSSRQQWRVEGTQHQDPAVPGYLDIIRMSSQEWIGRIRSGSYTYVINCAGILKPAVIEGDFQSLLRAIRVNASFPHELAEALPETRILHISTDGVFGPEHTNACVETDATDCPDAYGKTKALGECPAQNVLNFRCSIVGRDPREGKGLIEWLLRAPEGSELCGFEDHLWNGVTTNQFAELCTRIITLDSFENLRRVSGVFHFCPNPPITKFDLLCGIAKVAGRTITVRRSRSGTPCRRILGTLYSEINGIFPTGDDWPHVLKTAVGPDA